MQYKIAIVDDNEDDIFVIKRMLLKANRQYNIVEYTDPVKALRELKVASIDCIFLDYNFPEMNGLEFIRELSDEQNIDTPIILLTGQGNEKIAVESLKNGALDYIVKGEITTEVLKISLTKAIEKRDFVRKEKTFNEFIKTMVDIIPVPLFYKDRKGIFLGCNRSFEAFIGKSKEEIIGNTTYEISDEQKYEIISDGDNYLINNPGKQTYESEYVASNNEKKYVVCNKVTYLDDLGEVGGIIGIINDITDIKVREAELLDKTYLDSLTGILNRRYFDENIHIEWNKCIRESKPMSLIMLDIDFFKNFNDYYGHQEGDDCLRKIAQEIKLSLLRPSDMVIRYGGEEFIAVLPETNPAGALKVAKRIQENIINLSIESATSPINEIVTISQGLSTIYSKKDSIKNCLINADKALYMAKGNGRNKIESFNEKVVTL